MMARKIDEQAEAREQRGIALRADLAQRMPVLFAEGGHLTVNVAYRRGEVPGRSERIILILDLDDAARLVRISDALVALRDAIRHTDEGGMADWLRLAGEDPMDYDDKVGSTLGLASADVARILDRIDAT